MADDQIQIKFNMSIFQQKETDRKTEKYPHATGSLEIPVEVLDQFFACALALEPEDHWSNDGTKVVKLRLAAWDRTTKDGRPMQSITVQPDRAAEWKDGIPFTTGACEPKAKSEAL